MEDATTHDRAVLAAVVERTLDLLDDLRPSEMGLATPCRGWDVATLVRHLRTCLPPPDGEDVPPAIVELVAHGWDLAVATGRPVPYTNAEAAAALRHAQELIAGHPRGRGHRWGPVVFVPHSAPPIDRFIGLTGRRPPGQL